MKANLSARATLLFVPIFKVEAPPPSHAKGGGTLFAYPVATFVFLPINETHPPQYLSLT